MALSISKSSTQFQIQQSQPILFLKFFRLTIFLFLHFPSTNSFSFNFSSFQPGDSAITYEGDAFAANGIIHVTTDQQNAQSTGSVGRAYYSTPIHLWDSVTGNLTDFTTHFSFNMTPSYNYDSFDYGDGLAFFLSPHNAKLPKDSGGGYLGLFENSTALLHAVDHIVAVEFDTYSNVWDPKPWEQRINHVGIDVNSIQSVTYLIWNSSFVNSTLTANAWVNYNSSSMTLSVYLTEGQNPVFQGKYMLSTVVNLTEVLPEWVNVGFSAATSGSTEIYSILSWTFESTLGGSYNSTPTSNSTSGGSISTGTGHKAIMPLVAGLAVSIAALSCGVGLFWYIKSRKTILPEKNKMGLEKSLDASTDDTAVRLDAASTDDTAVRLDAASTDDTAVRLDSASTDDTAHADFEKDTGLKEFTLSELKHATNNFSEKGKLGEGGFGFVYKGVLGEKQEIAVKRISKGSDQGINEFKSEVKVISKLRHKNLVQLIGWCKEQGDLILVYKFMPNGSLDTHLYGTGKSKLSWEIRYKIAVGLATALDYLHEQCEQYVIHRDIKSSNIMLDSNYVAKLGDFGLARLVDHELHLKTTVVGGTKGYLAPECVFTGKASKESDVYSFGVVALEIACGRKALESNGTSGHVKLVELVWSLYGQRQIFAAVDKALAEEYNESQAEVLIVVGLWCCHPDPNRRPTIRNAIDVLSAEGPLPILPSQMPPFIYSSSSSHMHPGYSSSAMTTDSNKDATRWSYSSHI